MGKRTERNPVGTGDRGRGLDDTDYLWIGLLIVTLAVNAYVIYGLKSTVLPVVHEKIVKVARHAKPKSEAPDCGPGTEPIGGGCAEINGTLGREEPKDELGYPKP